MKRLMLVFVKLLLELNLYSVAFGKEIITSVLIERPTAQLDIDWSNNNEISCNSSNECPLSTYCKNGKCIFDEKTCTYTGECGDNLFCISNTCKYIKCQNTSDCPTYSNCSLLLNGWCQKYEAYAVLENKKLHDYTVATETQSGKPLSAVIKFGISMGAVFGVTVFLFVFVIPTYFAIKRKYFRSSSPQLIYPTTLPNSSQLILPSTTPSRLPTYEEARYIPEYALPDYNNISKTQRNEITLDPINIRPFE